MNLIITGGAGFIGSNFIRHILKIYPDYKIINLDKLAYAGNLDNLKDIENNSNYKFVKGDICDKKKVDKIHSKMLAFIKDVESVTLSNYIKLFKAINELCIFWFRISSNKTFFPKL